MKNDILSISAPALLLLCAGCATCATDTGFYVESESVPITREIAPVKIEMASERLAGDGPASMPNAHQDEVRRTFDMPKALNVISPKSGASLVGRWRCEVCFDSRRQFFGGYVLGHGHFCEEYNFQEDGSFSKWRVSKRDDMIMPATEERGRWEYRDGIIKIQREYGIMHMDMLVRSLSRHSAPENMLRCQNLQWQQPFDWRLQWHSDSEFTVGYSVASDNSGELSVGPFGALIGVAGRCDADGCFRSDNAAIGDIVVSPLRFKKIVD